MFELFDDVHKIRKSDSHMILIGNGKLIKHISAGSIAQSSLNTPEMQALVGRAIAKKYLPFSHSVHEHSEVKKISKLHQAEKKHSKDGAVH